MANNDWSTSEARERLDALATHPDAPRVFGYDGHHFRRFARLSRAQLADHERALGAVLPEHYRSHLAEVGNGGAGPGYGLFPLGRRGSRASSTRRTDHHDGNPAAAFPHDRPWNLPATELVPPAELGDAEVARWNREHEARYFAPDLVDGTLPIAHMGCARWILLVLDGPSAGEVWEDDRASDGGILPVEPEGFTRWYLDWLAECEQAVG